jgi:hypothetical protein
MVSQTFTFTPAEVSPSKAAVLEHLGMPTVGGLPDRVEELYATAERMLVQSVEPRGIVASISVDDFASVYRGQGFNEPTSVVADIFPHADHLALFTVTLGAATSHEITEGFATHDFALASMLDAMASESADLAAERAERRFERALREAGWRTPDGGVLRYSPGYCGWDVTGQKQLFQYLSPERIGVTLTDSCLMQPLKSVSGVMIAGPKEIHRFPPTYSFCSRCETQECRDRIVALLGR